MIRYLLNKMLVAMKNRYDYDVRYMQDILQSSLSAFLKMMGFQTMSSHSGNLAPEPLYAARLRAIIWDDCGPCTQLVVNMALEANVSPEIVRAVINRDLNKLPEEISLVVRFTERVLAHDPEADDLREEIVALWGQEGLVTIAYCISSYRVYPALKYALGYGKACSRIIVNDNALVPSRATPITLGAEHDQ
ncbi:hypothetical protein OLMES_2352 [Oleiphilus messinensis]|uniref:Carboxymuconolactone decarboxylase-like domain-containing protein n=1 Tax=Oleiphilus messinensis TaxID=141451 RepID=A0A1Y0IAB4_9GAMM|nr:hypothetical protein [Oleiphilus messinensis]ARU56415.1 hypothetical protein OLMES_2352 [Oleiphilus messinensis]